MIGANNEGATCKRSIESLSALFAVLGRALFELNLARLLNEPARCTTEGGEAVGLGCTGDVVSLAYLCAVSHLKIKESGSKSNIFLR